ncbi:HAD family hydrolase [Quadrisphaera sp. GCM10027208]|uniref:HAD family hydrolase n=1 Tax=Quadrisphaera sp. GCM10027208 TaxID=3273423 RepID=UPI0036096F31
MSDKALLVDWGGVLTVPLDGAMAAWAQADGIDYEHFTDVMRTWHSLAQAEAGGGPGAAPVHALERGEIAVEDFERLLAEELAARGSHVQAAGLLGRMLAGLEQPDPLMHDLVRRARRAGLRTVLVSNSWGNTYDRTGWDELFDAVVISGEVGMRKPEPRIFHHAAALADVPVEACVLVDDLPWNVEGARRTGMAAVLHRGDTAATAAELHRLTGIPF